MPDSRRRFLVTIGEMVGVLLLALAGGWMARGAMLPVAEGPPVLQIDRTHVDFGDVTAGTELSATFRVCNAGSRRLVLRETGPGCDCLGERGIEVVPPGETVEIRGTLPTRGCSGPVQRELKFTTSDPDQPVLTLSLVADVQPGA